MDPKKLTDRQLLGEQGVALIASLIAKMGFVWRPTPVLDTGIDGEIELRDTATGEMSGLILKVQSKAVSTFTNDSAEGFDFWATRKDVNYWLKFNVPVILVVSRPATGEAYWLPVRERNGQIRPLKFRFSKATDRLDEMAAASLLEYTRTSTPGARGFALRREERLTSNLFPVKRLPPRLFLAETPHGTGKAVSEVLRTSNVTFEYALRNKRVLTPRDLTDPRYAFLCDRGTVEDFPTSEWANSSDPDKQRDFVWILNQCLTQFLRTSSSRIRRDRESRAYYFPSNQEALKDEARPASTTVSRGYPGQKKMTSRDVVKPLLNKAKGHVMGYRHAAIWAQFARYDSKWYLEVTPTYRFTQPNGITTSKYSADWLAGIKALEKNGAVLGQLIMWQHVLVARDSDLFVEPYPFLAFEPLLSFWLDRGLDDAAWTPTDEAVASIAEGLPEGLFGSL